MLFFPDLGLELNLERRTWKTRHHRVDSADQAYFDTLPSGKAG